jgi:hypothetical protein
MSGPGAPSGGVPGFNDGAHAPASASRPFENVQEWKRIAQSDELQALRFAESNMLVPASDTGKVDANMVACAAWSLLRLADTSKEEFRGLYLSLCRRYLYLDHLADETQSLVHYVRGKFHSKRGSFLNAAHEFGLSKNDTSLRSLGFDGGKEKDGCIDKATRDLKGVIKEAKLQKIVNVCKAENVDVKKVFEDTMSSLAKDIVLGVGTVYGWPSSTSEDERKDMSTHNWCKLWEDGKWQTRAAKIKKYFSDEDAAQDEPAQTPEVSAWSIFCWNMRASAGYHKPKDAEWSSVMSNKVDYLAKQLLDRQHPAVAAVIQEAPGSAISSARPVLIDRLSVDLPYFWKHAICNTGTEAALFLYDSHQLELEEGYPSLYKDAKARVSMFKRPPVLALFRRSSNPLCTAANKDARIALSSIHLCPDSPQTEFKNMDPILSWIHECAGKPAVSLVLGDFNFDITSKSITLKESDGEETFKYDAVTSDDCTNLDWLVETGAKYDGALAYTPGFSTRCRALDFLKNEKALLTNLKDVKVGENLMLGQLSDTKNREAALEDMSSTSLLTDLLAFMEKVRADLKYFALNNYSDHKPLRISFQSLAHH